MRCLVVVVVVSLSYIVVIYHYVSPRGLDHVRARGSSRIIMFRMRQSFVERNVQEVCKRSTNIRAGPRSCPCASSPTCRLAGRTLPRRAFSYIYIYIYIYVHIKL